MICPYRKRQKEVYGLIEEEFCECLEEECPAFAENAYTLSCTMYGEEITLKQKEVKSLEPGF